MGTAHFASPLQVHGEDPRILRLLRRYVPSSMSQGPILVHFLRCVGLAPSQRRSHIINVSLILRVQSPKFCVSQFHGAFLCSGVWSLQ